MQISDIVRFPSQATGLGGRRLPRNPDEIIADEAQWRVRPDRGASAAGSRIVGTRWRVLEGQVREAAAATPEDCHVIGIPLRSTNLRLSIGGRTLLDGAVMPGTPLVAGPGAAADCLFRGACDELHLHAPNALIAECAGDIPGCEPERLQDPTTPSRDPMIERLGWTLLGADDIGGPVGQLYVDCISLAVVARLLGAAARAATAEAAKASPLPRWRLRRAIDYVEARLDEPVTLADLAGAAGLTRMHFAAQFRAATGLRPHEYLLRRRIERSQEMLLGSDTPIVEVAMSVGFQTQSHFTTVFKRFTGQPPLVWRHSQQPRSPRGDTVRPRSSEAAVLSRAAA